MKHLVILMAALACFSASNVFAQHDSMDMAGMDMGGMSGKTTSSEGVGVVDSVDQAKKTVTISHEPIASLNWSAMTMDFAVEDKTLFNKLLVGKKINFQFIKQGSRYVVKGVK
jgi:Cu(I)/Ag(I) efflux system protein CusF